MKCHSKTKKFVFLLLPPGKASRFFKLLAVLSPIKFSYQTQRQNSLRAFFTELNIFLETLQ